MTDDIRLTFMEAITFRRAVSASYNGDTIKLAPHFLFERHGDLFVCALNMGKTWRQDEERRLGQFKLAGLGAAKLLDETFEPEPGCPSTPPRPDDTLILAV